MNVNFKVNNKEASVEVSPKKRLLDILRDDLDLIATKEGCGKGECGACTVLMNGVRVNSCLVPAFQLPDAIIVTVEGLVNWKVYAEIEKAYVDHGAVQCGFCMSGFVMSTLAYLQEVSAKNQDTHPGQARAKIKEKDIQYGIGGNICRCTGHTKIIDAVLDLSQNKNVISKIYSEWDSVFHK
jgi:aerobic carbon-monoxide dehydrogenase small subunit